MDIKFLEELFRIFNDSNATEFSLEEDDRKIKLTKNAKGEKNNFDVSQILPLLSAMQSAPQQFVAPAPAAVQPAPASSSEVAETQPAIASSFKEITSPIVGTFYRSPSPESASFVEVGSKVKVGDTLCIIEAMKLMNEIESDVSGTIEKILINNAEPVEFGQVMFLVKPD